MEQAEVDKILTRLKEGVNTLIDPGEIVQLIEQVGMLIDDLDLEIIETEQKMNQEWQNIEKTYPDWPKVKVTMLQKISGETKAFKYQSAVLKSLRRHYRLLNTKLNLITKPRGR